MPLKQPLLAPPLKIGDMIGFFSPSFPVTMTTLNSFNRAKNFFINKGFRLKAGNLTVKSDFYRSGTIRERTDELNTLFRDPEVRCIMSTTGGYNSNYLLPYLDYQALVQDPKIIIGYSDDTALLAGIYAKIGLVTFYGPALVAFFGELPTFVNETYQHFCKLLMHPCAKPYYYNLPYKWIDERLNRGTSEPIRRRLPYKNKCFFWGKGTVEGRVIGGNLNTLSGITYSKWMPEIQDGDILFIEESQLDIAIFERSFSMLKSNGVFDKVNAIILGKRVLFNDAVSGRQLCDVLREVLAEKPLPLVDGFDCSHRHPMLTLPFGARLRIDFDNHIVAIIGQYLS